MKKEVGLWIDHRKAVIVTIDDEGIAIKDIKSNVDKHVRFSSGTHSKTQDNLKGSTAEDMRDRQYDNQLGGYYEGIISIIREADSIWIIGPGEAKVELESRLRHDGMGGRILGVETVDKMTNQQIAAKVRDRYQR